MGITRRTFIKGLGSGITAVGLSDVVLTRSGWAGAVAPAKTKDSQVTTSICPFCGVGCGLIANTKGGKLINVEGDPDHPINQGSLCSKGQAVFEVVTSPRRLKKVRYRAPGSDHWEEKSLEWAMATLAQRLKATRDQGFITKSPAGGPVNRTEALASIGGAALNNEECYLISKLTRALGIVYLEHQARL
ncbi:MAG: formate dehydrogenase [Desulfobacca sp. RBG_16_60_12]|nr:MAG: formate dehydrogenase [Desulfobacca sp. RBG_16_60_12]